jgi:hypothetical protein
MAHPVLSITTPYTIPYDQDLALAAIAAQGDPTAAKVVFDALNISESGRFASFNVLLEESDLDPITRQTAVVNADDYDALYDYGLSLSEDDISNNLTEQTATGGTTTTIVKTGAGWGTDVFLNKVVTAKSGTNGGKKARVTGNTSDTITFTPAMPAANDNTTHFYVSPGLFPLIYRIALAKAAELLSITGTIA